MLEHGIFAQNRFLLLLLLLLSYFITKAFIADSHLEYIVSLLFMLMVAFCLYAIGHSRQFIIIVSFCLFAMYKPTNCAINTVK